MVKYKLIAIVLITLSSCKSMFQKQEDMTLIFNGETFELFSPIPMAFGKDTLYPELWTRTFNVDGDNQRIIRLINKFDTAIIELPNAVSNYTETDCFALKIGTKRLLWVEDNFGTTVVDMDLHKTLKVKKPKKKLNEIAPTGAPIGTKKKITVQDMKRQLEFTNERVTILDSLSFKS